MKKQQVDLKKKLTLKKMVVAGLSTNRQNAVKGGATIDPSCQYTFCFCVTILTRCC